MVAVETLGELGFRTAEAGTAGEALERLRNGDGRIDAALIDIGLPDRKGDALAAELRAARPELPIVLASGYAGDDLRRAFADDRRVAVLGKPYARAQLEAALRSLGVGARR
jgi:CheY-like chemotaxis protein